MDEVRLADTRLQLEEECVTAAKSGVRPSDQYAEQHSGSHIEYLESPSGEEVESNVRAIPDYSDAAQCRELHEEEARGGTLDLPEPKCEPIDQSNPQSLQENDEPQKALAGSKLHGPRQSHKHSRRHQSQPIPEAKHQRQQLGQDRDR